MHANLLCAVVRVVSTARAGWAAGGGRRAGAAVWFEPRPRAHVDVSVSSARDADADIRLQSIEQLQVILFKKIFIYVLNYLR